MVSGSNPSLGNANNIKTLGKGFAVHVVLIGSND